MILKVSDVLLLGVEVSFSKGKEMQVLEIDNICAQLNKGSPVLIPTDTLPALSALPRFASKIWDLKKRSLEKPLILMGASSSDLLHYVEPKALKDAWEMADLYWPGALTMVLPASSEMVAFLNPGSSTLGMRVPASKQAQSLLKKSGPLATTSANISGFEPSLNEKEAAIIFPELPLLSPIPWSEHSGLASSVISWESSGNWKILRKGAIIPKQFFSK